MKRRKLCLPPTGFSLVELVVVITILALLWTIALLAFQSYSSTARDSERATDMKSIEKWLKIYKVTANVFPLPDNKVDITSWGSIIRYQGTAGDISLGLASLPTAWRDPKDDSYYTYITNSSRTQAEVVGYYENQPTAYLDIPFVTQTYASYPWSLMRYVGKSLGIILQWSTPLHEISSVLAAGTFDIKATAITHTIKYSETDQVTWIGTDIITSIAMKDKAYASTDDTIIGFYDMETTTTVWWVKKLKDFSQYGNHALLLWGVILENGYAVDKSPFLVWNRKATISSPLTISPSVNSYTFTAKVVVDPAYYSWQAVFSWWNTSNVLMYKAAMIYDYGQWAWGWWRTWVNSGIRWDITGTVWDHIAFVTIPDGTTKVYLNGVLKSTANGGAFMNGNYTLSIMNYAFWYWNTGCYQCGTYGSVTKIDEVRVYKKALSDTEILNLYNSIK